MSLQLDADAVGTLFPFHIALGVDGRVRSVGAALERLLGRETVGERLAGIFIPMRPTVRLEWAPLQDILGRPATMRSADGAFSLRGQWVQSGEVLLFAGTPWLRSLGDMAALGLQMSDFAAQDPVGDFLFLLQGRDAALADARELHERVSARSKELERAYEELKTQRSLAQDAVRQSQEKSSFLAGMSHELRTPLNAIIGYVELMLDDLDLEVPAMPVAVARHQDALPAHDLQRVLGAAQHLLSLIDDILDLAKVEAGRMEVRSEPVVLCALLEDIRQTVRPLADRRDTAVLLECAGLPACMLDGKKLKQILLNLVANGIRATKGGTVWMRGTVSGDRLLLEVADDGHGMDDEVLARLFKPFVQGPSTTVAQRSGGTGLGLTISKLLAQLMGGDIAVESKVGEGSTFWVELPLVPVG